MPSPPAPITPKDIYQLILNLVRFPNATVCRHSVALDLISLLESHGYPIRHDLVKNLAMSSEGDDTAETILKELTNQC